MKTLVLFYSTYGHVWKLAEAVAEGARQVAGNEVVVKRVPETLPKEILDKTGATGAQQAFAHLPVVTPNELAEYDAIIFGTPTRYGNLCGQMQSFMDSTGGLFHTELLHHGFIIVGLPYAWQGQMGHETVTGGTPYGASTVAGGQGERQPSENELEGARFQGKHTAEIAKKVSGK
jgi:NAD(P)H dehydrogenase (quinone)